MNALNLCLFYIFLEYTIRLCDQRDLIDAEIFEENNKIKTSHTLDTKRQDHINTILIVKPRLDVPLTLTSYNI